MRRRVYDSFADRYGTAVEHLGRGHYRIEWDEPTPHQATARPEVPSKHFHWVDTRDVETYERDLPDLHLPDGTVLKATAHRDGSIAPGDCT